MVISIPRVLSRMCASDRVRAVGMGLVLAVMGCSSPAPDPGSGTSAAPLLTDRIWERADSTGRPGVIRIFLSDGTLLQDSCWETHRRSLWSADGPDQISWEEDGVEIRARVTAISDDSLRLRLELVGGIEEERYRLAEVPWVCPDMPKQDA